MNIDTKLVNPPFTLEEYNQRKAVIVEVNWGLAEVTQLPKPEDWNGEVIIFDHDEETTEHVYEQYD